MDGRIRRMDLWESVVEWVETHFRALAIARALLLIPISPRTLHFPGQSVALLGDR